ncbi:MAG: methyltransferase domain-containing protein [Lautropia sp.]
MSWNPKQYLKFEQPRLRPALDLAARIEAAAPRTVWDLGCGTGSLTRLLAARWPQARVTGVDGSADMLARAAEDGTPVNVVWQQADLTDWVPAEPADVIFSNAALQWISDHALLLPRLFALLAPGGVMAVQMPRNYAAASHRLVADTIEDSPFRERLEPLLRGNPVAEPAWYYDLLASAASRLDIWETEYLQVLSGPDPVKEWTKGTALAPFLAALAPDEAARFEADYAARLRIAYPMRADGTTLFPFRRLFIVAVR